MFLLLLLLFLLNFVVVVVVVTVAFSLVELTCTTTVNESRLIVILVSLFVDYGIIGSTQQQPSNPISKQFYSVLGCVRKVAQTMT